MDFIAAFPGPTFLGRPASIRNGWSETLVTGEAEAMQLAGQGTSLKARPVQPKHGITSPQRPSTQVGIRHGWWPPKISMEWTFRTKSSVESNIFVKGVYKHNDISTFFCSLFRSF